MLALLKFLIHYGYFFAYSQKSSFLLIELYYYYFNWAKKRELAKESEFEISVYIYLFHTRYLHRDI